LVDGLAASSYLITDGIGLVFSDIPLQIEELIGIDFWFHCGQFSECFDELHR